MTHMDDGDSVTGVLLQPAGSQARRRVVTEHR